LELGNAHLTIRYECYGITGCAVDKKGNPRACLFSDLLWPRIGSWQIRGNPNKMWIRFYFKLLFDFEVYQEYKKEY